MRHLLSLIFAISCINAAAQMQPDSSVVIMSHWTKGDSAEYKITESSYTVIGSDTTNMTTSKATLAFKVLKREKDSYKMSLNIKDDKKSGSSNILFTTDSYGRVQSIDNLEKLTVEGSKHTKQDPSAIRESISKYLNIFSFHGTKMKLGEDYNGETEVDLSKAGLSQPVKARTNIYLDPEHTNDKFAVARMAVYTEEKSDIPYQQFMSIQIHLGTGWPVVSFFDRFIDTTTEEGIRSTEVQSEYIELVL